MSAHPPHTPLSAPTRPHRRLHWSIIIPLAILLPAAVLFLCERLRVYTVPNDTMAPTIKKDETIIMEGATFFWRSPRRGDVIVFKSDGIPGLPPGQRWVKRVIGEPGDHLKISEGKLYIHSVLTPVRNATGEIPITAPPNFQLTYEDLTIPPDSYFTIGDNAAESWDSRSWGCVPRANILGRVCFRQ